MEIRSVESVIGSTGTDVLTMGIAGTVKISAIETVIGSTASTDALTLLTAGAVAVSGVETVVGAGLGVDTVTMLTTGTLVASNVDSVIGTAGADTIVMRGASTDTVWAGGGADSVTAGTGADHFLYKAQGDSGLGVSADTNTGFNAGNAASTVDQLYLLGLVQGTMHFAGNAAFSSNLGNTEVRAISGTAYGAGLTASDAVIQVDLDGNGTADMEIKLLGTNVANIDQGDIFGG